MEKVKVGIAGLANHGVTIRNAARASKNIEIVAAYDINESISREFAEIAKCKVPKDFDEMVNDPSIDAMILVTPNFLHLEQSVKAFEKGKHVFLEKPITNNVKDSVEIIKQAKKYNKILQIGYNMRKRINYIKAKEAIAAGKIGQVVTFYCNFSHDGGFNPNMPKWKASSSTCPLLPMMQIGIHFLDAINFLMGDIKAVNCWAKANAMGGGILDTTLSNIELTNGIIGTIQSHYIIPAIFEYKIFGTKGTVYAYNGTIEVETVKDGNRVVEKDVIDEIRYSSFDAEIQEFADCVIANKKPEVDGAAGLKSLMAVEAMIKSYNEKRNVEISEILSPEDYKELL
jgi:predicted dehydrogenase